MPQNDPLDVSARERYEAGDYEQSQWPRPTPIQLPIAAPATTTTPPQVDSTTPQVAQVTAGAEKKRGERKKKNSFLFHVAESFFFLWTSKPLAVNAIGTG